MTRFARGVMSVVTGLPSGLLTWPGAAQAENDPAVMPPPTGAVHLKSTAALPASGNQSPAATSTAGTPENVLAALDRSAAM